jgi:hypothetical protein
MHLVVNNGKKETVGISSHLPEYGGSVVVGRIINHSIAHDNVTPKLYKAVVGNTLEVIIYFETKRHVKVN